MELSKAARNAQIEKKHREGATMSSIASEFGISPTRVRDVLAKLERNRRTISRRLEAPLRKITKPVSVE